VLTVTGAAGAAVMTAAGAVGAMPVTGMGAVGLTWLPVMPGQT
jgi:hypothetical protein